MTDEAQLTVIPPPGGTVRETKNGLQVRDANGRLTTGTRPANMITSETSRQMHKARADKTARLLRQYISENTLGAANKPVEALARVGSQIFAEVAANKEANPRYRLEAWQAIGRHAQMLADNRETASDSPVLDAIGAAVAREIVAAIEARRRERGEE